jgi:hypothetical protein
VRFLIDASENAGDSLPSLKEQTLKAIEALKPKQYFNIVLLRKGTGTKLAKKDLMANPVNKKAARDFLANVKSENKGQFMELWNTISVSPNLDMCFVAIYPGMPDLDQTIRRIHVAYHGRTKINVILIGDFEKAQVNEILQLAKDSGGLLKQMAREKP